MRADGSVAMPYVAVGGSAPGATTAIGRDMTHRGPPMGYVVSGPRLFSSPPASLARLSASMFRCSAKA